ncbi:DUF1127 domain-containing protein [Mariluticola halotolerans]|uniref:DUF1127 domain-containing protein n=1 Tax=Mariluticola halotolerans TaxID=2909283 RepID=UPI0026E48FFF|nr:DUF1127 domain-containing protein [Mariluticola halotolerans]UJQ95858.1 DUF1127 domain-containing protein [Mariluticola halotolerans]
MAYLLASERSTIAAAPFTPFHAVVTWLRTDAELRARRKAMKALLQMDEDRLLDLGLTRQDIVDSLHGGPSLSARRAERARAGTLSR